jgi:predicted RNA-binding protein YlxR (DUF448 family)
MRYSDYHTNERKIEKKVCCNRKTFQNRYKRVFQKKVTHILVDKHIQELQEEDAGFTVV